jgi:AraC family transcriptional regulator, exoenzyme S synthesis regulatory protein ExsA
MLNFYEFVNGNPMFKQFKVDELLFTAYDCPIEVERLDYWTQKNYFVYTLRGKIKWKIPNNEYLIGLGDAVFVKKGTHRTYKVLDGDYCALLIFVPDEFIKTVIKNHLPEMQSEQNDLTTDSIIPLELDEILSTYFISVLNYFSQPTPPSKSLLKIRFEELIVNIMTSKRSPLLTHYFKELCCDQKRSIKAIMEDNFAYNLKLAEYAKLCGRSIAAFKRDFVKIYDTTPGRWLKAKRLEYGKFLLEITDMNINQITLESGFENTSHFIKAFKEKYQHSPLHYKKLLQTI